MTTARVLRVKDVLNAEFANPTPGDPLLLRNAEQVAVLMLYLVPGWVIAEGDVLCQLGTEGFDAEGTSPVTGRVETVELAMEWWSVCSQDDVLLTYMPCEPPAHPYAVTLADCLGSKPPKIYATDPAGLVNDELEVKDVYFACSPGKLIVEGDFLCVVENSAQDSDVMGHLGCPITGRVETVTIKKGTRVAPSDTLFTYRPLAPKELRRALEKRGLLREPAPAREVTGPEEEVTGAKQRGVRIGTDRSTGEAVRLAHRDRTRGVTFIGATGTGKTTLLEHLILKDAAEGTAAAVIDPRGDLTRRIISLAAQHAEPRLILLEAWQDRPFRLNVFECADKGDRFAVDRTVKSAVALFKKLFSAAKEYSPRLERDLEMVARTIIPNDGTLMDVPRVFEHKQLRDRYLRRVDNDYVHAFWAWYERQGSERDRAAQIESTINRLTSLLGSEFTQEVVGSRRSTVPFAEVLNGSGILVLNIAAGRVQKEFGSFLGALFLCVLTERIFDRADTPEQDRCRLHLYLDEYQRFATSTTVELLTEARGLNVGVTLAHQTRTQLDEENQEAELQTGTLICTQLTPLDAQAVAPAFPVKPDPQWEERLEEIEGVEPVMAIAQEPVKHLLKTHQSARVREAVGKLLEPVERAIETMQQALLHHRPRPSDKYLYPRVLLQLLPPYKITVVCSNEDILKLSDLLQRINALLVKLMERRIEPHSEEMYAQGVDLLMVLAPYTGFPPLRTLRHLRHYGPSFLKEVRGGGCSRSLDYELIRRFHQELTRDYRDEHFMHQELGVPPPPRSGLSSEAMALYQRIEDLHRQQEAKKDERVHLSLRYMVDDDISAGTKAREVQKAVKDLDKPLYQARDAYERLWIEETAGSRSQSEAEEAGRILEMLTRAFFTLCEEVYEDPILITSGQERPRVRVRYVTHPQRPHQDIWNELASTLASPSPPPPYTAHCKTPEGYHVVNLRPPADGTSDPDRIERVRERSWMRYGLPIEKRSKPQRPARGEGSNGDEGPPIGRRPS